MRPRRLVMAARLVAVAHFTPSPVIGELIVIGVVIGVVVALVRDRRHHPWVPRSGCNGTGIRRSKWNGRAIGPCRRHRDGQHMRRRWGAGPG